MIMLTWALLGCFENLEKICKLYNCQLCRIESSLEMHCKLIVDDSFVLADRVFDLKCIWLAGSCLWLILVVVEFNMV